MAESTDEDVDERSSSTPPSQVQEDADEDERILSYLRDRASGGECYLRAKHIADSIGLTAKQVGARLPRLAEESDDVDIEKWGRARSTTWRVTPQ